MVAHGVVTVRNLWSRWIAAWLKGRSLNEQRIDDKTNGKVMVEPTKMRGHCKENKKRVSATTTWRKWENRRTARNKKDLETYQESEQNTSAL